MPGMDRKGPLGLGPMTGRALGMCASGVNALRNGARSSRGLRRGSGFGPGQGAGRGLGAGFGRTFGRGLGYGLMLGMGYGCRRGWRNNPYGNNMNELDLLEDQKQLLENRLKVVNRQLEHLAGDNNV